MLANVSERTSEIGIRRAVGANQKDILLQFLIETILLTMMGACLGVFVAICFSYLISYIAEWKTVITVWSVFLALTMACLVGLCSGLYSALQAAKMDPIKALR
jgi:putative ABC transport system permease protein